MTRRPGVTLLLFVVLASGCAAPRRASPPVADFLLVAGDSTYWVTAQPAGFRMRGEPLILARFGGRFHEVYVADDDHSYEDALLVGQFVFSRDLITNDSTIVFVDTLVDRVARAYAAAHPDEAPLDPDDPVDDLPIVTATSEVTLLDVDGPYLSLEYHADTRRRPEPGFHTTWRTVVDMRTGNPVRLDDLIGPAAASRVVDQGRRSYTALLDSARGRMSELPDIVPLVLAEVSFDPGSFTLVQLHGRPAVEFAGRMSGRQDVLNVLHLPVLPIDSEAWWAEVRPTLPMPTADGREQWVRPGYTVRAAADTMDGSIDVTLVDSTHHVWALGRVHAPLRHVFWLDRPRIDSTTRLALRRAFDDAVSYGEDVRVARLRLPLALGSRVRAASNVRISSPRPAVRRPVRRRPATP